MKAYRVSFRDEYYEHNGYKYFSNKKEAQKMQDEINKKSHEVDYVEELDIELTKHGVLSFLNIHCSHPDNG